MKKNGTVIKWVKEEKEAILYQCAEGSCGLVSRGIEESGPHRVFMRTRFEWDRRKWFS
jgi:hypothetical protein